MPLAIIVAQWHHITLEIFVNTGSGNGFMPDGMKSLPQVDLNNHDINQKFFFYEIYKFDIIPTSSRRQGVPSRSYECLVSNTLLTLNTPFGIFIVSCYIGLHLIQFCYIPQVMMNGIIYYTIML